MPTSLVAVYLSSIRRAATRGLDQPADGLWLTLSVSGEPHAGIVTPGFRPADTRPERTDHP
jgi:hypothetical protein